MGLAIVEFVMDIEETFDISIPDEESEHIRTVRDLIDYLVAKLRDRSLAARGRCPTQRAFYSLRRAAGACLGAPRAWVRPETPWNRLLPWHLPDRAWSRVAAEVGVSLEMRLGESVGDTARRAAGEAPQRFGWPEDCPRERVAAEVRRLIAEYSGVREYTEDVSFIRDLGID